MVHMSMGVSVYKCIHVHSDMATRVEFFHIQFALTTTPDMCRTLERGQFQGQSQLGHLCGNIFFNHKAAHPRSLPRAVRNYPKLFSYFVLLPWHKYKNNNGKLLTINIYNLELGENKMTVPEHKH